MYQEPHMFSFRVHHYLAFVYLAQKVFESNKSGSVWWFVGPALHHELVDIGRTMVRLAQPLSILVKLLQNLKREAANCRSCCEQSPAFIQLLREWAFWKTKLSHNVPGNAVSEERRGIACIFT